MSEDLRVLPLAPLPVEGELLSSWQWRLACRYGLSSDGLAVLLGAKPDNGRITFAERDYAPDDGRCVRGRRWPGWRKERCRRLRCPQDCGLKVAMCGGRGQR